MSQLSSPQNSDLSLAGWLLVAELICAVVASLLLSRFGGSQDFIFPCIWLFNFLPAWHLSKAAKALGKSSTLYGLAAALLPALAIFVWTRLRSAQLWQALEQKYGNEA
jgi:hypothetical protein